ncbi:hypothetical protein FRB93_014077 [Tulasnella sp. JGI-2019a]|nr:hypothetical protein FRB93_014077 [Tulasnella sp. JGI-2019a]
MTQLAGLGNIVRFTHLSPSSCAALQALWPSTAPSSTEASVKAMSSSVLDVMKEENVTLSSVCLLDPKAEKPLTPEDGDGRFKWFLFGVSSSYNTQFIPHTHEALSIREYLVMTHHETEPPN